MKHPDKFRTAVLFAVLALLAFAVRLPQLGARPMHTDEAINAYITGRLLDGEPFRYDPRDRHGPALSVTALPIVRALGVPAFPELTESELRMEPVIAGAATVLLFCAGCRMLGLGASLVAAACFAFAALPVYYSRYFIHETLFVAATLALILGILKMVKSSSSVAAGLVGLSAALMLASKETAVLHFFALGVSALVVLRLRPGVPARPVSARNALFAAAVFAGIAVLLFSWFGQYWKGLASLLHGAPRLVARAAGQGHEKPFWYYILLLGGGWSGAIFLLLAAIGIGAAFRANNDPWRTQRLFIAVYAVVITVIYCAIPYKTPWLALNLWLPLSIMAGVCVEWLWNHCGTFHKRFLFCFSAMIFAGLLARDTWQRVFIHPGDEKNPYAYSQTVDDLLRLEPRISQLVRERNLKTPRIAVVAADPWPLPWYLRKFPNTGFWQPNRDTGPADFTITSQDAMNSPGPRLGHCSPEFFGIRPDTLVVLWIPDAAGNKP